MNHGDCLIYVCVCSIPVVFASYADREQRLDSARLLIAQRQCVSHLGGSVCVRDGRVTIASGMCMHDAYKLASEISGSYL